jgi:sugar phosphate isomerase/epimerase
MEAVQAHVRNRFQRRSLTLPPRVRIGVDSYSYHRLLGELRPGEPPAMDRFRSGDLDVIREARALGVDGVSLETCFLDPPDRLDAAALSAAADSLEVVLAWGAPHGLEFGASRGALADLLAWISLAPAAGCGLLRIVVGGPRLRGREPVEQQLERTVAPLVAACEGAAAAGVALALENHGDLTAAELLELLERVGHPALGVCFDTVNAVRVGDDALEAARLLGGRVRMVHLKDCEPLDRVADPVAGPRSVPFGEGVIPLESVLEELRRAGFDALVCVELGQLGPGDDERALVAACVEWLRERLRQP